MFTSTTLNVNITNYLMGFTGYFYSCQRNIGVTTGGHIGDFSGDTKKKGKTLSFDLYLVNSFCSSNLSRKCQTSHFLFCDTTSGEVKHSNRSCHANLQMSLTTKTPLVTLIWFPNNSCSIGSSPIF